MIRLKELRTQFNINQQKLAMDLNISQSSISKYELGTADGAAEEPQTLYASVCAAWPQLFGRLRCAGRHIGDAALRAEPNNAAASAESVFRAFG